jgi:integrase/recombinase XerD
MAETSPLRRRMIEDMTVRNLSPARACGGKVQPAFRLLAGSAGSGGRARLSGPSRRERHSWAALNQTVCALRFFYGVTLGHGEIPERIRYARDARKLPVVLSADEVVCFLEG